MKQCLSDLILPVKVNVPMEMVCRLENPQEPAKGFDPLMRKVGFIVNSPRRGMRNEYIQVSPIYEPVLYQYWNYTEDMYPHLELRILKRPVPILKTSLDPSKDQPRIHSNLAVKINPSERVSTISRYCVFNNA
jgi:hypothetical protein